MAAAKDSHGDEARHGDFQAGAGGQGEGGGRPGRHARRAGPPGHRGGDCAGSGQPPVQDSGHPGPRPREDGGGNGDAAHGQGGPRRHREWQAHEGPRAPQITVHQDGLRGRSEQSGGPQVRARTGRRRQARHREDAAPRHQGEARAEAPALRRGFSGRRSWTRPSLERRRSPSSAWERCASPYPDAGQWPLRGPLPRRRGPRRPSARAVRPAAPSGSSTRPAARPSASPPGPCADGSAGPRAACRAPAPRPPSRRRPAPALAAPLASAGTAAGRTARPAPASPRQG
ncbi:hypothetical protein MXAN_7392 [Myxococcus xanthus DK 1622]|uniref:Uncharacterized protein n=1 Tax=Myxococcus xanthus (strain DK1622) TaxID=246197 RepID=Q1CVS4_MYXXD|nr:hypothetical protein MXAN_7392 [Myxococcus xanthus DK 1622]